jgi:rod shape-determining protein MreD
MVKKLISFFFLIYFLVLLQISFLPHFLGFDKLRNWLLNPVLILVIIINFLEKTKENFGIWTAFFAGFLFDIFSENFIGFYILPFLSLPLFIKYFFKRHVQVF